MCGIAGVLNLSDSPISGLRRQLEVCNSLQRHRGPDGSGVWVHDEEFLGLAHTRLSIIDIEHGSQPMRNNKNCITYNGEIYNYIELQSELGSGDFITKSDTEVILKAYDKWGIDCLHKFRGMFSFALWDEKQESLFCARDCFGIKPFYYTVVDDKFYFASEIKAILPFVKNIEIDLEAFKEYLSFQFCLNEKTLFKNIFQLLPGHFLTIKSNKIDIKKYWEVKYELDFDHTEEFFERRLQELLEDSMRLHTRSDVPIGGYLSGGLDSSAICSLGNRNKEDFMAFTGKFSYSEKYDESFFAKLIASKEGFDVRVLDITHLDFIENIRKVIYHLDQPVAGPGSFSQYMISKRASEERKVLLGGQGGDEIFGGYTRYLIAYFEQCIKAAVNGTLDSGNFIVTYNSIIPNLKSLKNYKPLLERFWKNGLFDDMDKRYFSLVDKTPFLSNEVNWNALKDYDPYNTFRSIFYRDVNKESYFDLMTHFDSKTLLPALLHVEDRMGMAHGIESRVPLLDRPYVEFAATIPSSIKFKNGNMKHIFKKSISKYIPEQILNRKDKMGFPTPFSVWSKKEINEFIIDTLSSHKASQRDLINNNNIIKNMSKEDEFDRSLWGFLSLELWQQEFHDKEAEFKKLLE
jgi:asparagine synthase (glutamine-hydrolysing)